MSEFSIGATAKLTGITVHNLRIWEKRYGLSASGRTESGRRLFSQADIDRLTLIKRCIDLGHSISHLANLDEQELRQIFADLSNADLGRLDTENLSLSLAYISAGPCPLNEERLSNLDIHQLSHFTLLEKLREPVNKADIVIIDSAFITEEMLNQVASIKATLNPALILFIYRLANRNDLQRIRNLGVRTVRAPIEALEIEDIISRFVERIKNTPKTIDFSPENIDTARTFTREQLDKLAEQPYNINCECPRHISEIIKSLEAFELYSMQCQNRNDDDAALHAKIYQQTALARRTMENILGEVLESEGITLN